jgi:glycosyltransferase involved in cell wall biosynthesis
MKILHIIPNLKKGGAERIVIDIVRQLNMDKSLDVKLVLFENQIEYEVQDLESNIKIIPSQVRLSLLKKNEYNLNVLQSFIEDFQPAIIHSHLYEAEVISRSCFYPSAKWFTHSHDRMRSFNNLNFRSLSSKRALTDYFEKKYLLKRYAINGGNHFIAISEDIKLFLKSVLPLKISTIHLLQNAIDVKRFEKPAEFVSTKDNKIFELVSIGRLDKNKNHQFLVDVVKALTNKQIPVNLTIIGDGTERKVLQEKINHLDLAHRISLVGIQDNVEEFLWNADLYVHSALTEGFGLTLLEAMAAGLPVITIDGGGNKNLIRHGENGFIITEQDVSLFSEFINELFQNPTLRELTSNYAKEFANNFDITTYIDQLITIYKKAL